MRGCLRGLGGGCVLRRSVPSAVHDSPVGRTPQRELPLAALKRLCLLPPRRPGGAVLPAALPHAARRGADARRAAAGRAGPWPHVALPATPHGGAGLGHAAGAGWAAARSCAWHGARRRAPAVAWRWTPARWRARGVTAARTERCWLWGRTRMRSCTCVVGGGWRHDRAGRCGGGESCGWK